MFTPRAARADWPEVAAVIGVAQGERPFGGAIRNWGPTDDVFIAPALNFGPPLFMADELHHFTCSNNDGCATATLVSVDALNGGVYDMNLTHPALAIKRASSTAPVDILGVSRFTYNTGGSNNAELDASLWDSATGFVNTPWFWVQVQPVGVTENVGIPRARFRGSEPWSCYTYRPGTANDRVACNFADAGSSISWGHGFTIDNDGRAEDHPTFAFYGEDDDLVVAGIRRDTSSIGEHVRVHFPAIPAAFPTQVSPPRAVFTRDSTKGVDKMVDFVDIESSGGWLYLLYVDGQRGEAEILLRTCQASAVDCSDVTQWSAAEVVADSSTGFAYSAQMPQIAVDGSRQFIVWQFDDSEEDNEWRVAVATRCGTNAWNRDLIRTAPSATHDQFIAVGRPSLVLNRNERIAHVVLTESAAVTGPYAGRWTFNGVDSTTLYWYRKGYNACN